MSDRIFLDTNIIIYAHSDVDLIKQNVTQNIITSQNTVISTQVLQETANVFHKKSKLPWALIIETLKDIAYNNVVYINTQETVLLACTIADKYHFSFYDSLIIASAIESDAKILYSEDMQHNQLIENRLRIINPFK
ncbi:PIN domain-containing protein [Mucilaginibacter paludis]|uniref:PilT protein domain protein n=1 Tax=Mucilaginibacter paludis DSM 18603 TaxID=714943 RepID=H1XZI7_9SPHI|nr:PIN domain-containing protein [Mucilaginibacter paludis]EHQ26631.1 PilT protein domain protein [Mucilaginibacter paludis DSM 18603]